MKEQIILCKDCAADYRQANIKIVVDKSVEILEPCEKCNEPGFTYWIERADMPTKSRRFCLHPGCNELTTELYCEKHKAEHDIKTIRNQHRKPANERGYDNEWAKVRNSYIRQHPLCETCEAKGLTVIAEVVHHVKPIDEGGARLDVNNLKALCRNCHEVTHNRKKVLTHQC